MSTDAHQSSTPAQRYTAELASQIEARWQKHWSENESFRTLNPGDEGFDASKPKFYCLDMFPYPSGKGLHVGHPLGYIATDIISRYRRMCGYNVLHPMGWDAFGLPAEQYAIQTGVHPAITTKNAIDTYRRQLSSFGMSYDWSREIATIDADYYRWTQWIWLKAYESFFDSQQQRARPITELRDELAAGHWAIDDSGGLVAPETKHSILWDTLDDEQQHHTIDLLRLAYLDEQMVNWCPALGTVLANEEVIDGKSERGHHPVTRRPLRQWMFRITAYADRLLNDLESIDWPNSTKTMQREWIGRSEGADIDFELLQPMEGSLRVYTTRADTLFGATFMVVAPEHPLIDRLLEQPTSECNSQELDLYVQAARNRSEVDRMADTKDKTGVFTGAYAVNPATGNPIPIWVADYVLMGYGHGSVMAVPGHDQRDNQFAKKFNLPIVEVVRPAEEVVADECFSGEGLAAHSSNDEVSLDGLQTTQAKKCILDWLESNGFGRRKVNYKLRDWLFSRQRYWGEPFPIVYDSKGDHYGIKADALPVELPELEDYKPVESSEPQPMLAKATQWHQTTAGEAGVDSSFLPAEAKVTRELLTMPGWAGSCWYYLRYCDPKNNADLIGKDIESYWVGPQTDSVGGVDLYVGGTEHAVLHLLYARFWHKLLHDFGKVTSPEPFGKMFHQGLLTSFAYQRTDGSLVPVDEVDENENKFIERATGDEVIQVTAKMSKSLRNVINPDDVIAEYGADTLRLYEMYMGPLEASKSWNPRDIIGVFRFLQRVWRLVIDEDSGKIKNVDSTDPDVDRALAKTIQKVSEDIERLAFNTAIASIIEFTNLATAKGGLTHKQTFELACLLSPFAPHMGEEMNARLGEPHDLASGPWPVPNAALLKDDKIELPVQIMGKVRGKISVAADASAEEIEKIALKDETIAQQLADKQIRKVVVVPGKIINIVAQ